MEAAPQVRILRAFLPHPATQDLRSSAAALNHRHQLLQEILHCSASLWVTSFRGVLLG